MRRSTHHLDQLQVAARGSCERRGRLCSMPGQPQPWHRAAATVQESAPRPPRAGSTHQIALPAAACDGNRRPGVRHRCPQLHRHRLAEHRRQLQTRRPAPRAGYAAWSSQRRGHGRAAGNAAGARPAADSADSPWRPKPPRSRRPSSCAALASSKASRSTLRLATPLGGLNEAGLTVWSAKKCVQPSFSWPYDGRKKRRISKQKRVLTTGGACFRARLTRHL